MLSRVLMLTLTETFLTTLEMSDNETTQSGSSGLLDGVPPIDSPVTLFVLLPLATVISWYAVQYFTSPLRKYPGPFLGGMSFRPPCGVAVT